MMRRLFNFASGLSLLLFLLTVVLLVRSYFRADLIMLLIPVADLPGDHGELTDEYGVLSTRSAIRLEWERSERRGDNTDEQTAPPKRTARLLFNSGRAGFDAMAVEHSLWGSWQRRAAGFAAGGESYRGNRAESDLRYIVLPHWAVAVPLLIGAFPFIMRWRRNCAEGNCCPACDYNLTGNASGICPECGTPVTGNHSPLTRIPVPDAGRTTPPAPRSPQA